MKHAFTIHLDLPFNTAIERLIAALAEERLGIVSDVDVSMILKKKLNEDIGGYRILGACAPGLASRVIRTDPSAGALLPCNLVVREVSPTQTAIDFMDPVNVLALAQHPDIEQVAIEARTLLEKVANALSS